MAVCSNRDHAAAAPERRALAALAAASAAGYARLLERHTAAWEKVWRANDIEIVGDDNAQQGIRFCIFNMHQNYAGNDPLVNIPAKGLTGPGYGGLIWWDTEAFMMPFFLYNEPKKARMLLTYRHRTIAGAWHKAQAFGHRGAMFPWVTIDGEERSGDWEYGMLEQHVGAAVAHAIRQYADATGDDAFLWEAGAEVVIETSRFWASRANWHAGKGKYVINFVTGPDEYTVAVNNNCYTNFMAAANLEYGLEVVRRMKRAVPRKWRALAKRLGFEEGELKLWRQVARKMLIPYAAELGIHEQDDSFLGRDPFNWRATPADQLPRLFVP